MRASLVSLLLLVALPATAQKFSYFTVETNLEGSGVLVDDEFIGAADGSLLRTVPGTRTVAVIPPEVGSWMLRHTSDTLQFSAGDTLAIRLEFPYTYRIDSNPFGAQVMIAGSDTGALGVTPLVFVRDEPLTDPLVVQRDGYLPETVVPGDGVLNTHSVALRALSDKDLLGVIPEDWRPPEARRSWINYVAAGLVLTGGALAVHYKFKADRRYDRYVQNGDEDLKREVDRLDRRSYVALAGMQVGVGVIVFRLAF